jgi:hypothetical protein
MNEDGIDTMYRFGSIEVEQIGVSADETLVQRALFLLFRKPDLTGKSMERLFTKRSL